MSLQSIMWAGLALTLIATTMGCREWYRGGGARQALSNIPGIAVYIVLLAGSGKPWLAGLSLAVAGGFLIYAAATTPQRIPWQSAPGIGFVVLVVLLALMTAWPDDVPRGVSIAVLYALMALLATFAAAASWTLYKAMIRARATNR